VLAASNIMATALRNIPEDIFLAVLYLGDRPDDGGSKHL
jgi:hypothetical protein